ncbi:hypothetical protein N431DRAFT_503311 [Stipitochalara longipes BDJ]|nr:hypothetical protein N431DRAFT_503311 [Stipitochalara longipes BDJ]
MASFSSFKGEKLIGSSNYIEWKTNADLFLEINGYMSYINGTETSPDKELYYKVIDKLDDKGKVTSSREEPISPELGVRYADRLSEYNRNSKRALGALKSIISIDNNDTFGQSTLELIGRYFDKIVDNNYNSFNNMDEYTSNIQSTWLILKGLPSSYDNYTSRKYEELSGIIKDGQLIKLISDLIAEEGRLNSNIRLEANKTSFNNSPSYCKYCNKKGHTYIIGDSYI